MACTDCTSTTPNGCTCQPGRRGDPGPANNITLTITMLPSGSAAIVVPTGVSPNQFFDLGIPFNSLPVFSATATEGPVGVTVGGTPANPALAFSIPSGTNGTNGWGTSFGMLDSFNMPAPGSTTGFVTIDDNRMLQVGTWVKSEGIGGSWFVVVAVDSDDQVQLRNPGPTDLTPYWGGTATSIPTNAATSTLFPSGTLFVVVGAPGIIGLTGSNGTSPVVTPVYTPPSSPPATEADAFVIYYNESPPGRATEVVPYTYNYGTLAWEAGPNIAGVPGTLIFNGSSDPNIVPVGGSAVGDMYLRYSGNTQTSYRKISASGWTQFGVVPTTGSTPQDITHASAGTQTLDLAYLSYNIQADKDIELDWTDSSFSGQAEWIVSIKNNDGSPIALTYASSQWERDPALTLPATVAAGATQTLRFIKDLETGLYIFTSEFVAVAV